MSSKGETSINKTINEMRELLVQITQDLEKSSNGNKAASQRVRTGTVKLEKTAKAYRKESIQFEKKNKGSKKATKPTAHKSTAHKATAHKSASKSSAAAPKSHSKAPVKQAARAPAAKAKTAAKPVEKSGHKPAAKAKSQKAVAKPHAFALKRPTAKLPVRKK